MAGLTVCFLLQASFRVEDAQRLDKFLEVYCVCMLRVEALKHLVYKNAAPALGLEKCKCELILVNQSVLQEASFRLSLR